MHQIKGQDFLTSDDAKRLHDQLITPGVASTQQHLRTEYSETERLARESEARLQTVISNLPAIVYAIDRTGIITLLEGKGVEIAGQSTGEAVITPAFDLFRDVPEALKNVRRALAGEAFTTLNEVGERAFESRFMPVLDQNGDVTSIICVAFDVTEHVEAEKIALAKERQAEEALRESRAGFRSIMQLTLDAIIAADSRGKIIFWNTGAQRMFGYMEDEVLGQSLTLLMPERFREAHERGLERVTTTDNPRRLGQTIEITGLHKDGGEFPIELSLASWKTADSRYYSAIIRDISERKRAEERLRYHTLHDPLTNLPNRVLLQEQLEQALLPATRCRSSIALLMIDLDRFKEINDTVGYQHGDVILQQVAVRLHKAVSASEIVARLDGDKFAILLTTADEERARKIASEFRSVLDEPFIVTGFPLQIQASIGCALYPQHGADALTLIRCADMAMYAAKRTHEGYTLYNAEHDDQESSRRLALLGALRQAIIAKELTLYYQPKADLKTGTFYSVEALARWQHPKYGFVPPDQFIALAEQTGLITSLTHWVLETAIQQCSNWLQAGLDLSIAVNLSMWNLRETSLPDTIARLLEQYSVPARHLRVELTESAIMADSELALDVLKRLSALGICISIDDFGTGYSSLAYLKRLPVDELKIDRSFVQHMASIEADETIVRSTVTMAHSLGLQVVAEGVEDQATWNILSAINCDIAQGYYMSRPLPAPDLEHWLRNIKQPVGY